MVIAEQSGSSHFTFILRPNRSLTWRGNLTFLLWMAMVSSGIAIWFASVGAWLVLPFAGLEMACLAIALYLVSSDGLDQEVVSVDDETVEIGKGRRQLESIVRFQRSWARLDVQSNVNDWYPDRLFIRSHGRQVEIGSFLDNKDRKYLASELKQLIKAA